jgi:anionic cell wall polymer biosynthesis LytR-Cps2A-Psr (LCP) family protein
MKKLVLTSFLSTLIATVIATVAYSYNITHPGLKKAYDSAEQAIKDIQETEQYNKDNAKGAVFGGHENNALEFLKKAQNELIEGDQYNDAHQKKPK